ncbi:MAG: metal-dependent hydrolase [Alphaproteobacteria bacterium]|nr:metal-dependent hydrolase [Alphaproteobacteria bacterium]
MLIAHLPAGYLLARRIAPRLAAAPGDVRRLMAVGLAASVFPDIDLVYFYLADGRQTLHHDYWTHLPAFWPAAMLVAAGLMWLARARIPWREFLAFLAGVCLHLVLDTATGGIAWGWPVSLHRFLLVEIPARFDWWVWSFVLHWTFLAELAIVGWAAYEFCVIDRFRDLKRRVTWRILARPSTDRPGKNP